MGGCPLFLPGEANFVIVAEDPSGAERFMTSVGILRNAGLLVRGSKLRLRPRSFGVVLDQQSRPEELAALEALPSVSEDLAVAVSRPGRGRTDRGLVDAEWRRRSREIEAEAEEEAGQRRWAARLSGEPYLARERGEWLEVQLAGYRLEEESLQIIAKEVLDLRGRDPRWTPLGAFLGDRAAADALGVEVAPPRDFKRWVDCLHYWAGGEAHLRAAAAVAEVWAVGGGGLRRILRAARAYVASPSRAQRVLYLKEAERDRFRLPGGGVRLCHPPPASVAFLDRVLRAANDCGADEESLRSVIRDALLRWVRAGSSPPSPPSPSIR